MPRSVELGNHSFGLASLELVSTFSLRLDSRWCKSKPTRQFLRGTSSRLARPKLWFPDSTLCGNVELGGYNQVAVAQV